jgi:predicted transposase YbfD/YdcC
MIPEETDDDILLMYKILDGSIGANFGDLKDPRREGKQHHKLIHILFITILATLAGANNLKEVALYATRKQKWLESFLHLTHGVPCYVTFWWIFVLLKPSDLEKCFLKWVQSMVALSGDEVVAIDGKALRGTAQKDKANSFVHMVSAWASQSGFTLGQLKVDTKSNEITAIPKLLDVIDIEGATVTIDAMGCQTDIASKIIEKGANYVLALKGNQGNLHDELENFFEQAEGVNFLGVSHDVAISEEDGHGRTEKREVYVTSDIDWLPQKDEWANLQTIIMIKSHRLIPGKPGSIERRFYISSLPPSAAKLGAIVRKHWGIENKVHWLLDVAFREDSLKAKVGNIAENTSIIRRIALNLLKRDTTIKAGIEAKRKVAAWDDSYLVRLLL